MCRSIPRGRGRGDEGHFVLYSSCIRLSSGQIGWVRDEVIGGTVAKDTLPQRSSVL